jgi:hypothetical protein
MAIEVSLIILATSFVCNALLMALVTTAFSCGKIHHTCNLEDWMASLVLMSVISTSIEFMAIFMYILGLIPKTLTTPTNRHTLARNLTRNLFGPSQSSWSDQYGNDD